MERPNRDTTTAQTAAALGVSTRQVRRWVKAGCPTDQKGRQGCGRPLRMFDLREVRTWLVGQGIAPRDVPVPATELAAAAESAEAQVTAPPAVGAPTPPAPEGARRPGYDGMLERFRLAELTAFARWAAAANAKESDAVRISALARTWGEIAGHLRKLEKDSAGIRKDMAGWLQATIVRREFTRIGTEIKMALLSIPRTVAPLCEGKIASEIETIVKAEVLSTLELLYSGGASWKEGSDDPVADGI